MRRSIDEAYAEYEEDKDQSDYQVSDAFAKGLIGDHLELPPAVVPLFISRKLMEA